MESEDDGKFPNGDQKANGNSVKNGNTKLQANFIDSETQSESSLLLKNESSETLSQWEKVSFGFGNAFNDLTAAMWFSYVLFFLQVILSIEPVTAGFLIFFGQIVDGLSTPILGMVTDKYLSRKTWYCIGTVIITSSFPLMFLFCPFCWTSYFWMICYFCAIITFFQIGWAMVQISHLSMIPDIPGPDLQRAELTTYRFSVSVVSSIVFYLITWAIIHIDNMNARTIGPNDLHKFKEIAAIVTTLGVICSLLFLIGMRNYREVSRSKNLNNPREKTITIPKTLNIFLSPVIYQVSSLYVAARLFLILNLIYMPLFLDERQAFLPQGSIASLEASAENLASVPLVSYIASFFASIVLSHFVERYGNKLCYLCGSLIGLAGCLWISLLQPESVYSHIYGSAVLLGAGSAITLVTSLSITADFIGSNTGQGAFVYSVVTFADKVLTGCVVLIIEQMKCSSQDLCPEYYRHTFVYVCGGSCVCGCLILSTLISTNF